MKIETAARKVWEEYERGRQYNTAINLYKNVEDNENFYNGDQWKGCNAPDLPKPTLNFLKRVVNYVISVIVSDDVAVAFTPHEETPERDLMSKALAKQLAKVIERTKYKRKLRTAVRNAAVDGDACIYVRFDPDVETGQTAIGDIACEVLENINVIFGNPYSKDVEEQPYIILAQRKTVAELKEEAEKNGAKDAHNIISDSDSNQMERGDSDRLATKLTKLWKEAGQVWAMESTENVIIREPFNTEYSLYPVCWMPYEEVKSSYHGQAILTGLISNQIEVNRLMAYYIISVRTNAYPKLVYDGEKIKNWTEKPGVAIRSTNLGVSRIQDAVTAIRGGDVSYQVMEVVNQIIDMTRDFMGANDAALGNVKPDNTSAIIAVQQGATMPLQIQKMNLYQFAEDFSRICIDIMRAKYGVREVILDDPVSVPVTDEYGQPVIDPMTGQELTEEVKRTNIDFSTYNEANYEINVNVGSSSYFSELLQVNTLDNLFQQGIIADAVTYIESMPAKYIPNREKIISDLKERQKQAEAMPIAQDPIADLESQVAAAREQYIGGANGNQKI